MSKARLDLKNAEGNTLIHLLMINFKNSKQKSQIIGDEIFYAGAEANDLNNENWAPIHIAARKAQDCGIK